MKKSELRQMIREELLTEAPRLGRTLSNDFKDMIKKFDKFEKWAEA